MSFISSSYDEREPVIPTASEADCRLVNDLYDKGKGTKQMSDNKSLCDTCKYMFTCEHSDVGISIANHFVCYGYTPIKNEEDEEGGAE